jgi:hypothetical protein
MIRESSDEDSFDYESILESSDNGPLIDYDLEVFDPNTGSSGGSTLIQNPSTLNDLLGFAVLIKAIKILIRDMLDLEHDLENYSILKYYRLSKCIKLKYMKYRIFNIAGFTTDALRVLQDFRNEYHALINAFDELNKKLRRSKAALFMRRNSQLEEQE